MKLSAYPVYLLLEAVSGFSFRLVFTVNLVYQVTVVGLNPLELVLVGTVLEATAFLFEIPTGIVADMYSRRASIILGIFITGVSFILQGLAPRFEAILLSQVIWGIGYTFTSGATEAWISDEIGEANAGRAFLRAAQIAQIAGIAGIALSVALAQIALTLPIIAGGVFFIALGAFLLFAMPERGFKPAARTDRATYQKFADTFRGGLAMTRTRPALITIFAITAMYGAFSESFDRLSSAHLLNDIGVPPIGALQPVTWFGIFEIIGMVLSILGAEFVRRRVNLNSQPTVARTLMTINTALIALVLAFAFVGNFAWATLFYLASLGLRQMNAPIQTAWVNQRLDPAVRATVISMSSQMDALGQIAGGPIVGAIGAAVSVRAAIAAGAGILGATLLLYARVMRRDAA